VFGHGSYSRTRGQDSEFKVRGLLDGSTLTFGHTVLEVKGLRMEGEDKQHSRSISISKQGG
jgi:hypothetical protein